METAIQTILALASKVIPLINDTETVQSVIDTLEAIVPLVVAEYSDLLQPIKNIITALTASDTTTPAQMVALQTLDATVDAAFDASAAAFAEAHPNS